MENQNTFIQKLENSTLFFTEFIESKLILLITIFLTSLPSLLHIGFVLYIIQKSLFDSLFGKGDPYFIGVGITVLVSIIFDLALVVFSVAEKSKIYAIISSLVIVYINYVALQYHITELTELKLWDTLVFVISAFPVFVNTRCVFAFHKKEEVVVPKARAARGKKKVVNQIEMFKKAS